MRRREIVMIFSDFFTDPARSSRPLQRMRYNMHEVVLFHVLHHSELTFDFDGMVKSSGWKSRRIARSDDDLKRPISRPCTSTASNSTTSASATASSASSWTPAPDGRGLLDYLNSRSMLNRGGGSDFLLSSGRPG